MKIENKIKDKKIFVTGGAGLVRTSLIKKSINDNQIVIYDNFCRNALINNNLGKHPNIKLIKSDVLDIKRLEKSMEVLILLYMLQQLPELMPL